MAIFNWFGESEHRVFNYKPRYYDPEKEALKKNGTNTNSIDLFVFHQANKFMLNTINIIRSVRSD